MNSYQKLKKKHAEEVARLKTDIHALISDTDQMPYLVTRERWRFIFQSDDIIWGGDTSGSGDGFLGFIDPRVIKEGEE